jgi:hypothetical protein
MNEKPSLEKQNRALNVLRCLSLSQAERYINNGELAEVLA